MLRGFRGVVSGVLPCVLLALSAPSAASADRLPTRANQPPEVLELDYGGQLRIPAGALHHRVRVKVRYRDAPRTGSRSLGKAIEFKLVGPRGKRRLRKPVELTLPATAGRATKIRTYDRRRGRWRLVRTTFHPRRGVVTARLRHFSWYGDFFSAAGRLIESVGNQFAQAVGEGLGTRAGQAVCRPGGRRSNDLPAWVGSFSGVNSANDPVRACAQSEGEVLAIEIVNNRPYGIQIEFDAPVAWAWTEMGFSFRDIGVNNGIRVSTDGMYIPALSRGSVGIPRGSWTSANFVGRISRLAVIADLLDAALEQIGAASRYTRGSVVRDLIRLVGTDCSGAVLRVDLSDNAGDIARFITEQTQCVRTLMRLGYEKGKLDPARVDPKRYDTWLRAFYVVNKIKLGNRFAELLRDGGLGLYGGFGVQAKASAPVPAPPPPVGGQSTPPPQLGGQPPVTSSRRALTVDNRVTNGMGMREDTTPARLLTKPWVRCGARGCNINGTERGSGETYDAAICQTFGERTTNGHDSDASDDANPLRFESTRYYGVRLSNGVFGYVSETWIRAADRGGLGLPAC